MCVCVCVCECVCVCKRTNTRCIQREHPPRPGFWVAIPYQKRTAAKEQTASSFHWPGPDPGVCAWVRVCLCVSDCVSEANVLYLMRACLCFARSPLLCARSY